MVELKAVTALFAVVISSESKTNASGKGFCGWNPNALVVSTPVV